MLIITTFGHMMSHISEITAAKGDNIIYTYYSDSDTMPVNAYKTLSELGDKIKLVQFSELGNKNENLMLAAMARAIKQKETSVAVVGSFEPGTNTIKIDGDEFTIKVTPSFRIDGAKGIPMGAAPARRPDTAPAESKSEPAAQSAAPAASSTGEIPRFEEFMAAIPLKAVPRTCTKAEFAKQLYNAISHAACDSDILQVLESSIGPAAENAIEILNVNGAMPALKDIVRGN